MAPDGDSQPHASRRALTLAVIASVLILGVVAFLPEFASQLGVAPAPAPAPTPAQPPLPAVPGSGPQPAGPVVPAGPAVPAATGPLRVEVRDADDRAPIANAAVEVRLAGAPRPDAVADQFVDPATVEPHLRRITELRNLELLERSRPQLYHRLLTTGAGGVATFPDVPAGQAEIVATEREDRVSVYAVERPLVPPPGAQRGPVVLLLQRATGRITGRVIDDTGAPKPGAEILVVRNRPPVITSRAYALAKRDPYHRAIAGPDGRFALPAMPCFDRYRVHAKLPGWGSASSGYVAVERAAASDVTLVLRRNRIVRGVVRSALREADLTRAALVGYRIQDPAWRPGDSLRTSLQAGFVVTPGADGRYELEAANTVRYVVIHATLPGHAPVEVVVDFGEGAALASAAQDLTFRHAGRIIAGTVVDGAGQPVRAKVTFVREADNVQLAAAETDGQGRFHADWLGDAVYGVLAEPVGERTPRLGPANAGGILPDRHDLHLVCRP